MIKNFREEILNPLKWAIKYDKSTNVLRALLNIFENFDNEHIYLLKRELLFSIFGIHHNEIKFFLDLDAMCSEYSKLNINFYKSI